MLVAASIVRSPGFRGAMGENRVDVGLRRLLDGDDYRVLKNLTLPTGDGTTQIDHVVVSRFGIFVIETKTMSGWIFGTGDQSHWTQVIFRTKTKFQNPLRQNFKHVKVVQELLGVPLAKVYSLVVFAGSAVPKTPMPSGVVWSVEELVSFVRARRVAELEPEQITTFTQRLSENSLRSGLRTHRAHVKHLKAKAAARESGSGRCRRCQAQLVERVNRKTGERFLSCSRFPKCRGARPLDRNAGL